MRGLLLSPALAIRIEGHVRSELPREACGLMIGQTGNGLLVVDRVMPSANLAPVECLDRFEIDSALHLREQAAARESGQEILGIYHSHPNGLPEPSDRDLDGAWIPDFVWLILAPGADQTTRWGAFFRGKTATFEPLEIFAKEPKT